MDEADLHTPETVAAFRDAVAAGWPGAAITWSLSWRALHDERPNYRAIRQQMAAYHAQYGDDVTFIPGGYFANAYNTREQVNRDLHDGLAALPAVHGRGLPAAERDRGLPGGGEPALPGRGRGHPRLPGQHLEPVLDRQPGRRRLDLLPLLSLDRALLQARPVARTTRSTASTSTAGRWTSSPRAGAGFDGGFNSRMGVGPIETFGAYPPEVGLPQMLATTAVHFDDGFALNGFAWVTNCWEICLVTQIGRLEYLTGGWRTSGGAGRTPVRHAGGVRAALAQRTPRTTTAWTTGSIQAGTGIGGSDRDREIRWFMNQQFRLALLRDCRGRRTRARDRLTRATTCPRASRRALTRQWSLMGAINQKQTRPQDRPVRLAALPAEERQRIIARYPLLEVE